MEGGLYEGDSPFRTLARKAGVIASWWSISLSRKFPKDMNQHAEQESE